MWKRWTNKTENFGRCNKHDTTNRYQNRVHALHKNYNWQPEKVIVLTTLSGKAQIVKHLLGENGYFTHLHDDYRLPEIEFSADTIKVINENGAELDDILHSRTK